MNTKIIVTKRLDQSELKNHFYSHENSKNLLILFPGAGYPCMAPLLYYTTNIALELGFDVLNVEYDFRFFPEPEKRMSFLLEDIQQAIKAVEPSKYKNIVLGAKSVGTRGLSHFLMNFALENYKNTVFSCLWLTPAWNDEKVFQNISQIKLNGLHAIGSNDKPYFDSQKVELLKQTPNQLVEVIEGADHSLDLKTTEDSIKQMQNTITIIKDWLKNLL